MHISNFLLVTLFTLLSVNGVPFEQDWTITPEERPKLEKLRFFINSSLPHDYMREDIFLIKWLRAKELDAYKAEAMLRENLKWREENKMDTILEEDFGNLAEEYPYSHDGIDYHGRPVLAIHVSDWDIRKIVLQGLTKPFLRYASSAYERASHKIRNMRKEGKNVTQFLVLANFGGFNAKQHICPQCLDIFTSFLNTCETNYPWMADRVIGVKTPVEFQIVLNALWRPTLSKAMNDWVWLLGTNPDIWKKKLLELIPADQLDKEFGGTKPDRDD